MPVVTGKDLIRRLADNPKISLCLLIIASTLLRALLVSSGGQTFFVDEARFVNGHYLLSSIVSGSLSESLELILNSPAHTGFIFFSTVTEGLRYLYLFIVTGGTIAPYELTLNPQLGIKIASFILSLPSVMNIALLYAIIRRAGGKEGEALLGAALMSASCSMFYYSRHLVPYDCSIMLSLLALWIGVSSEKKTLHSFVCGFLACLALLTYNGYWILSMVVCGIHILWKKNKATDKLKAIFFTGIGGLTPILILQITSLALGQNYLIDLFAWSKATSGNQQGDFNIGWRVFLQYLWETEHCLLLIWITGLFLSLKALVKNKSKRPLASHNLGTYAFFVTYLLLILGSDILDTFVVYGRTARMTVPFLCIAVCFPIVGILKGIKSSQRIAVPFLTVITGVFFIQVALNLIPPLRLTFPKEIRTIVKEDYGDVSLTSTYSGKNISAFDHNNSDSRYTLINANKLIPPLIGIKDPPIGRMVLNFKQPYKFKPYQFIHHNEEERQILRNSDLRMTLLQLPTR